MGLLDARRRARDPSFAARVLAGLRRAGAAYGVPVLGGHTQLGVPAALSVTALGRAAHPVPGGGGRPGHRLRLTADLGGGWRPGYTGRQWDSTSQPERRRAAGHARRRWPRPARPRPRTCRMAGIAGTLGMLAEASGCGAVLDVAAVPRPAGAEHGRLAHLLPRLRDAHRRRARARRRCPRARRRARSAASSSAAAGCGCAGRTVSRRGGRTAR